ncbi:methylenetetrahydrofolate reductase C-terminal domain-containing protein [Desulfitobacterium sp.]|uniref:methylenetetrahydrofolate reductase C-terminal domain-containing protein n=1 Tax=Desulfitobacterium sp. TaxID=49981 RepID=UPI002B20F11A|nr:methylenetetrahydrofolate reductase C-terminal domain-containing protein [Desulfitobacterium sp.]MEA4900216.1 methylenetetrahydrofolate reductase C-terminal domain-containing protein [Desulfitobacterium sp.]
MENRFKESLLDQKTMSVTWELVPGRGARERSQENALLAAEQAVKGGRIHALTITDNPGGNPAMLADYLGEEILKLGIEPLVHFTCKDKNRNQMESQLYALDRAGVRNLLVMTGDYTESGFKGRPKPVFDLDPTHVLELIGEMNQGLEYPGMKGVIRHQPSDFFAGAAVSPFKATEAEQMVQYFKLKKKVESAARFIVTQLGYDARKFHEVIQFMRLNDLNVPIVGNIYILPYGAARIMNQNQLPGCVVTDKLLAEIDQERKAEDKGLSARLLRAAKMYAILKGMGFAGVHIGGNNVKYEQVEYIIDKGEELSSNWMDLVREFDYPMPNGFYYYEKDEKTGLNTNIPVNRKNLPLNAPVGISYSGMRLMHHLLFTPNKAFFPVMRSIYKSRKANHKHGFEHLAKVAMLDCKDCGDCAMFELAYLCPMSQCPKNQRNGACGGSFNGWCEVYPNQKKCIYVRAYSRLKKFSEEEDLDSHHIPPANWDLYQTSSWSNFYLGRDHSAAILGIPNPEEEAAKSASQIENKDVAK